MKNNPLKIYIAGPYTAETGQEQEDNVKFAINAAIVLFQKGHFPYIPHLTHFVDIHMKETTNNLEWEDYMQWHNPWLAICDAFLYLNSSKGADIELQTAKDLKKMIFYSINDIPECKIS